jgi:multiple sugar transport system permease protein
MTANTSTQQPAPLPRQGKSRWHPAWHIPLIIVALIMFFPFIWMVLSSFKTTREIVAIPPTLWPNNFVTSGYDQIFTRLPIPRNFLNSLIVCLVTTATACFTASLAGFVFAKYRFWGRELFFYCLIATMMVPIAVLVLPLYTLFTSLSLQNNYAALILPLAINGFGIFLMRQFMEGIPDEMMAAARIDGASEWTIFRRLALPLNTSPLAGVAVFTFLTNWNQFYWPLVIISKPEMRMLTQSVAMTAVQLGPRYDTLIAGAVVSVLPIVVLFAFAMRQVVESVTFSGGR